MWCVAMIEDVDDKWTQHNNEGAPVIPIDCNLVQKNKDEIKARQKGTVHLQVFCDSLGLVVVTSHRVGCCKVSIHTYTHTHMNERVIRGSYASAYSVNGRYIYKKVNELSFSHSVFCNIICINVYKVYICCLFVCLFNNSRILTQHKFLIDYCIVLCCA